MVFCARYAWCCCLCERCRGKVIMPNETVDLGGRLLRYWKDWLSAFTWCLRHGRSGCCFVTSAAYWSTLWWQRTNLLGTLIGVPVGAQGIESNLLSTPVGTPKIGTTCTFLFFWIKPVLVVCTVEKLVPCTRCFAFLWQRTILWRRGTRFGTDALSNFAILICFAFLWGRTISKSRTDPQSNFTFFDNIFGRIMLVSLAPILHESSLLHLVSELILHLVSEQTLAFLDNVRTHFGCSIVDKVSRICFRSTVAYDKKIVIVLVQVSDLHERLRFNRLGAKPAVGRVKKGCFFKNAISPPKNWVTRPVFGKILNRIQS